MRILHLQPELKIACGITKTIYLLVKNTSQEINHSIFTLGGDAIERFKNAKMNVVIYPKNRRGLFPSIVILIKIFSLVKKQKIDILHSHHRYFDLNAFIISKLISVKTITSVHSKVYGKKIISYKADYLIACSNSIKDHLIGYFKINSERIKVIYNFVDPKEAIVKIERSVLRRELGIEEQFIVIGFIGRFSVREKGVDILLESFHRLSSDYTSLILVLIGAGEDLNLINDFIKKNNLKVLVLPSKVNIFDYFNIIDIVVLPSRVDPFPLVMLESGMMKKTFIGSDVDGIKEFIVNGIDGFIFPTENVDLLTENLDALITNSELRIKFGHYLNEKVINNFTSEKIVPLYKLAYQKLLS
jgi:L-malate glycosyltransferase